MLPHDRAVPSGIRWVPQVGCSLSILLTVALVHVVVFPTLSLTVTLQVVPFEVIVQLPHPVNIPLSPSVLPVRVAVTFPLVGVVGL